MGNGVRRIVGFLTYFFFAISHSLLGQRRLMQKYFGRHFGGSALLLSSASLGSMLTAFLCMLNQRELKSFKVSHFFGLANIFAAFFFVLSQYCLLHLGFELSFLFLLLVEAANVLPQLVQTIASTRSKVRRRDATFSVLYSLGILLFIVSSRGPFDYWVYFLLISWLSGTALSNFFQSKALIYPGETRNAGVVVSNFWNFTFALTLALMAGEFSAAPAPSAVADCVAVSLFQVGAMASLLHFFPRTPRVRLEALFGLTRVSRIILSFTLYKAHVHFWGSVSMCVVVGARGLESVMRVFEAQRVEIFDHKKEREFAQSSYPPAAPTAKRRSRH